MRNWLLLSVFLSLMPFPCGAGPRLDRLRSWCEGFLAPVPVTLVGETHQSWASMQRREELLKDASDGKINLGLEEFLSDDTPPLVHFLRTNGYLGKDREKSVFGMGTQFSQGVGSLVAALVRSYDKDEKEIARDDLLEDLGGNAAIWDIFLFQSASDAEFPQGQFPKLQAGVSELKKLRAKGRYAGRIEVMDLIGDSVTSFSESEVQKTLCVMIAKAGEMVEKGFFQESAGLNPELSFQLSMIASGIIIPSFTDPVLVDWRDTVMANEVIKQVGKNWFFPKPIFVVVGRNHLPGMAARLEAMGARIDLETLALPSEP